MKRRRTTAELTGRDDAPPSNRRTRGPRPEQPTAKPEPKPDEEHVAAPAKIGDKPLLQPRMRPFKDIVADLLQAHPGITLEECAVHIEAIRGEPCSIGKARSAVAQLRRSMDPGDDRRPIIKNGQVWQMQEYMKWQVSRRIGSRTTTDLVYKAIEEQPGISAAELQERLDTYWGGKSTNAQIRGAVVNLRRLYDEDSAFHIVSYQGGYWFAGDLMRRGVTLYVTDAGTLRPVPRGADKYRKRIKEPKK